LVKLPTVNKKKSVAQYLETLATNHSAGMFGWLLYSALCVETYLIAKENQPESCSDNCK